MQFDREKIILLHPGKTGGSSVEAALVKAYLKTDFGTFCRQHKNGDYDLMFGLDCIRNVYLQHGDLRLYEMFDVPLRSYHVSCTVRRPYERVLSAFYYNGFSKRMDFAEFINSHLSGEVRRNMYESGNIMTDTKKYHINHFAPQVLYLKRNRFSVKDVIKCENLAKDTKRVLGLTIPRTKHAQTVASSKYKTHLDAYTTKMKDKVYNIYKEDFKTLGYRK